MVKSLRNIYKVMASHQTQAPFTPHHHSSVSTQERPAITLIILMDTLTFINGSIDNYNYRKWLSSSLKFQHLLLNYAAGPLKGTIKIIDCTSPINKACPALGATIWLILIMETLLFLHCFSFALFNPADSHVLWAGFYAGLRLHCLNEPRLKGRTV